MNNDPIETEGVPVAMTTTLARRDDAPALRNLVRDLCGHVQHAYDCAGAVKATRHLGCTCDLDVLLSRAMQLGCRGLTPAPQAPLQPTEAELAAHAAAGGFVGGLLGNVINGLVHGAAARKEARCAEKEPPRKVRVRADRVPVDPRRLGPGKGPRR